MWFACVELQNTLLRGYIDCCVVLAILAESLIRCLSVWYKFDSGWSILIQAIFVSGEFYVDISTYGDPRSYHSVAIPRELPVQVLEEPRAAMFSDTTRQSERLVKKIN